jgi:hypothetical protein
MSACFVYELGKVCALNYNRDARVAVVGVLRESADSIEILDVCRGEVSRKQLGICATLGALNFDNAFHHVLLVK